MENNNPVQRCVELIVRYHVLRVEFGENVTGNSQRVGLIFCTDKIGMVSFFSKKIIFHIFLAKDSDATKIFSLVEIDIFIGSGGRNIDFNIEYLLYGFL